MQNHTYTPNTAVVSKIRQSVADLVVSAVPGPPFQPPKTFVPSVEQLASVISLAFWASITMEESRLSHPRFVLATPDACAQVLRFEKPEPLEASVIAKIAAAFDNGPLLIGIGLAGDVAGTDMVVWGATHWMEPPAHSIVVAAVGSGVVHVEANAVRFVFERDRTYEIHGHLDQLFGRIISVTDDHERLFRSQGLREIASAMREHGHGGTMLFVAPSRDSLRYGCGTGRWMATPFLGLSNALAWKLHTVHELDRLRASGADRAQIGAWGQILGTRHDAYVEASRMVGLFTAVDGAVVIDHAFDVQGIGVKITAAELPDSIVVRRYEVGAADREELYADIGGTRHQSAARFVHAVDGAVALVASQDGRLSIFTREGGGIVRHSDVNALFT